MRRPRLELVEYALQGPDPRRQRVAVFGDNASQFRREGELFFVGKVKVRHAADMVPRPGRMNLRVRCGPAAHRWAVFASVARGRGHP